MTPHRTRRYASRRGAGVTLIELAITIAIVGIVAVMILQFAMPVREYIDTSRRAALADAADTALRRMGRDLRLALPNSVRVTTTGAGPSTVHYLEFLLVRTGGRYRAEPDSVVGATTCGTTAGDVLDIGTADTCFVTLGAVPNISQVSAGNDYLVVFNLQPETDKADAYQTTCGAACNKSLISARTSTGGSVERFTISSNTFTYESPGKRFFVIEGPVTYACSGMTASGGGVLTRYKGYGIQDTQPTPPGVTGATMVDKVSSCSFIYDSSVSSQGAGLVTISLGLTTQNSAGSNESVSLYHAVHVNNVP
jgi:MSHA biogenesis protein MshO